MEPADLYGLPLERFTEERNVLAKQLRQDGRRDEASRVSKLRKPSLAAWAVNQLVRTQRREVDQLLEAGDALQKAQADLLAGHGDPAELRQAVDAERAATDRLVAKARGLLSSEGHELTSAKLEQVSETLHAAALDEEARSAVRDGCLDRELRHVGLGALGASGGAGGRGTAPRRAGAASGTRQRKADRGKTPKPKPDLRAVREAEAKARRQMERAARELKISQDRRDRAAEDLRQAEEELAAARQRAQDALREHQQAERELEAG